MTQRTHEFGIRMALGAHPEAVLKQLLIEGAKLAAMGLGLGVVASLALNPLDGEPSLWRETVRFRNLPHRRRFLTSVALLACYIPARRAMRVDPMVALRYE